MTKQAHDKIYRILHIPSATFVLFSHQDMNLTCGGGYTPKKLVIDNVLYIYEPSGWKAYNDQISQSYASFYNQNYTTYKYKLEFILSNSMPLNKAEYMIEEFEIIYD